MAPKSRQVWLRRSFGSPAAAASCTASASNHQVLAFVKRGVPRPQSRDEHATDADPPPPSTWPGWTIPALEITGTGDGPRLTVLAGVHGCEYAPMAALRSWARDLADRELRGRVLAVPVLNLPAFRARSPFVVPEDGKNLNRCFPGNPAGSLAERLAYDTFTKVIEGSDAVIDMHAGDLVEALEPFTLYDAGPAEARARELAEAYGLGYVIRQEPGPDRAVAGTTSAAAAEIGIPAIIAEAGGCGLVEEAAVAAHLRGLNRVLAPAGHVGRPPSARSVPPRFAAAVPAGCTASTRDRLGTRAPVGSEVTEGQVLGTVSSIDGTEMPGDHHGAVRWRADVHHQFAGRGRGRAATRPGRTVMMITRTSR